MKPVKHRINNNLEKGWFWAIPSLSTNVPMTYFPATVGGLHLHHETEPAYVINSKHVWFLHNKKHRYDGPAYYLVNSFGDKQYPAWYICGNDIDPDDYYKWLKEMEIDIDNLTPDDKIIIDLKWGK